MQGPAQLEISDVKQHKHRTTAFLSSGRERIYLTAQKPCHMVFEPNRMDESTPKLNALLQGAEFIAVFDKIDKELVRQIVANSSRLLGKTLSFEEVTAMYVPCVKRKGDFEPSLRTKLKIAGGSLTRIWDQDGKPREAPSQWRHKDLRVKLCLSHLWFSKSSIGASVLLEDVLVEESNASSPFV